jgi:cell division protein FtsI (penicillin-binding protein 3)
MGQEVAVTPIQLVTMVSTIANGGVYLPPHVVMQTHSGQSGDPESGLSARPVTFGEQLPDPLPTGAHRVISTLAAAQMRSMMQDVVLYGTGRPAQLNGYSAGGKTGTAQKIDPATHRYSKTMHIASFAGFAPINNPVIAIVVVLDDPRGAYYGTTTAAPIFAETAQQVLEYLNIPYDAPVHPVQSVPVPTHALEHEQTGDPSALLQAMQELPDDDPLRQPTSDASHLPDSAATAAPTSASPAAPEPVSASLPQPSSTVAIAHTATVATPSFIGLPLRAAVERAAQAGLVLHLDGRGIARTQQPAAGSPLDPGSTVTVHFAP